MTTTVNPRSIGAEAPFITTDVNKLATLQAELVARGYANQVTAQGIVAWLVNKAAGRPDVTSSDTRAKYRKILSEAAPIILVRFVTSSRRREAAAA